MSVNPIPIQSLPILAILFSPFGFIAPNTLNYLAFYSVDFERHLVGEWNSNLHVHI